MIQDKKGRFGRWCTKKKRVVFQYYQSVENAPRFKYKNVMRLWQELGLKNSFKIRMIYKHREKGIIVV